MDKLVHDELGRSHGSFSGTPLDFYWRDLEKF
jgi:hypothetical protein